MSRTTARPPSRLPSGLFWLSLFVFLAMIGVGLSSAWWGMRLGNEALQGVNAPDVNPVRNFVNPDQKNKQKPELITPRLRSEADIIKQVTTVMKEGRKSKPQAIAPQTSKPATHQGKVALPRPLIASDQQITLTLGAIQRDSEGLILNVSLRNQSNQSRNFLYSFLDVRDNEGNALSAMTENLPSQLPGNGQTYTGTITIPEALLGKAQTLSLSLTDYPEQQLNLALDKIPVAPNGNEG